MKRFKTLRITSHFLRLMRLIFVFASLITFSSGEGQVPCGSVSSRFSIWLGEIKTCYMNGSTVIGTPDFTISTPRDGTVQQICFDFNEKISFLPLETANIFPNLNDYRANGCSIKAIKKENFQHLNKLEIIRLIGNQIETIFRNTFEGLTSLKRIDLNSNRISQINGKTFARLNNLETVFLNKNQCIDENFLGTKIKTLIRAVSEKCKFKELWLEDIDDKLDIFVNSTNKQLQEVRTEMKATTESKLIIFRLENELKGVKAEIEIKATTITRLEAQLDAIKVVQSQAESQTLLVKNLLEKLDSQHNQTCIAKTEELSRLENELKGVKAEKAIKATTTTRLEAQLESQTLFVKNLLEKLDSQHNQTCIAKTEELSRLENELKGVKAEIAIKATTIARLEAQLDASKVIQSQAESQTLLVKNLFEKLDSQHNQTCIAKTEELRNQIEYKMRQTDKLSEEQQSLRAEMNEKNVKIKNCEDKLQILSQSCHW